MAWDRTLPPDSRSLNSPDPAGDHNDDVKALAELRAKLGDLPDAAVDSLFKWDGSKLVEVPSGTYGAVAQDEEVTGNWDFPNVTHMGKLRVRHTPYADVAHKDWGAKGDGTTDDWQAFVDVDTFFGTDAGTIFAPDTPNSYLLSAAFKPSSQRVLKGASRGGAQLKASSPANNIVELDGVSNVRIAHLGFTHDATAVDTGRGVSCPNTSFQIAIDDCEFLDIARQAMEFFGGVHGLWIGRSRVENCFRAGVVMSNGERVMVIGNELIGFGDDGIAFNVKSQYCSAIGNILHAPKLDGTLIRGDDTSGAGIKAHHRNVSIIGNECYQVPDGLASIWDYSDGSTQTTPGDIVIANNTLDGIPDVANLGTQSGIGMTKLHQWEGKVIIANNVLDTRSATTGYYGIFPRTGTASPASCFVRGNTFKTGAQAVCSYVGGPFTRFEWTDNEIDTDNRMMRIDLNNAGGITRLRGTTGRCDGDELVSVAGTSGKPDRLTVTDGDISGALTRVVSAFGAVGTVRVQDNDVPASVGQNVNGSSNVDTLLGVYSKDATIDFGSIADGATASQSITVPGCRIGMNANVSVDSALPAGVFLAAEATDGSVRVTVVNMSGSSQDLPSSTFHAVAWLDA